MGAIDWSQPDEDTLFIQSTQVKLAIQKVQYQSVKIWTYFIFLGFPKRSLQPHPHHRRRRPHQTARGRARDGFRAVGQPLRIS